MKSPVLRSITTAALIAALYVLLTVAFAPLSFGHLQFRASELLTVLACFTPTAIPGLTVGCLLSNIASPLPLDMVFGTLATLLAAISAYVFRSFTFKGRPLLSIYCPVPINGLVVGAELCLLYNGRMAIGYWLTMSLWVAMGEGVVCTAALVLFPVIRRLIANVQP